MAAYDNVQLPAGPTPASYAPKLLDFSALANIGQQFQEGQQYGVKRGIQTAFKDGIPRDQNGNPDYNALASRMLQVGATPEAAQPYFDMAIKQGLAPGNQSLLSGQQPQQQGGQQQQPPQQTFTLASNAATGPGGITGNNPRSGPPGSILRDGEQIMGDGAAPQEGAGRGGLPAPFAGTRDQQTAQAGPPAGARTVTEDGTTGQPSAPTSGREVGHNGPQDSRMVAADRLDAQAALLQAQAAKYGQSPAAVKTLQDRAQQLSDKAKQYREAALKDSALNDPQKTAIGTGHGTDVGASEGAIEYQKEDAKRFVKMGGEISTGNAEAAKERPQLELIKSVMADPGFYSGAASGLVQKYKQWTVALGGDPNAGVPQEAFGKAVQNLALSQIRAMAGTGPVRVAEMRIIQQAIANKDYTPATNRLLIEMADRNYARNQQIATMARDYSTKNGRLDSGFEGLVSKFDQQHPIFSQAELSDPRIIAPQRFRTPDEAQAAGLPAGTPYTDMTGKHLKMIK